MLLLDYKNPYWKADAKKFNILLKCIAEHWRHYEAFLRNHHPEVILWIENSLPLLSSKFFRFNTKVYWIVHGLEDFPRCKECGRKMDDKNVRSFNDGYKAFCSCTCASNSKEKQLAIEETCLRIYGTRVCTQSDQVKLRSQSRFLVKYGVRTPMEVPEFKQKFEESMLRNHGGRYTFGCYDLLEKIWLRYQYHGIKFDSMPEIAFYIWLTDNQIPFEYHPRISIQYSYAGQSYSYFPDFTVLGHYVEIKGPQFFKDNDPSKEMVDPYNPERNGIVEAKHQCMLANNVIILTSKDYQQYLDYVSEKYGKNYLKQFKRNAKS